MGWCPAQPPLAKAACFGTMTMWNITFISREQKDFPDSGQAWGYSGADGPRV